MSKKLVLTNIVTGDQYIFLVSEQKILCIHDVRILFADEASNPNSDIIYPKSSDNHDGSQRPQPLAGGRKILWNVIAIYPVDKDEEFGCDPF